MEATRPTLRSLHCTTRYAILAAALGIALPAQGSPPDSASLADQAVDAHARVRATVGVPPLRWSPAVAAVAADWAQHLCQRARGGTAVLEHRPHNAYGENLFWQGGGDAPTIATAVASWADERRDFDPRSGQCRGGVCGHYTQLVWRTSTEVGCAMASCGGNHFAVCDYAPPGNQVGQRPY